QRHAQLGIALRGAGPSVERAWIVERIAAVAVVVLLRASAKPRAAGIDVRQRVYGTVGDVVVERHAQRDAYPAGAEVQLLPEVPAYVSLESGLPEHRVAAIVTGHVVVSR